MKDKYFIDTNIFVYSFDTSARKKQKQSINLIDGALGSGKGVISFQVINEFINVATKKFVVPMTPPDCLYYIDQVLTPLCQVPSSIQIIKEALNLKTKVKYSFYDCLILAAALDSGCKILYSEDLQNGFKYRDLTIQNPFE